MTGATNARAKCFNTMIQKIKPDARGFGNKKRLKAAIYFQFGGLDRYLEAVRKFGFLTRISEEPILYPSLVAFAIDVFRCSFRERCVPASSRFRRG